MIRLNMTSAPDWLTLAPDLRVQVAPLTTALMVSARADPAIEALSRDSLVDQRIWFPFEVQGLDGVVDGLV